MRVWIATSHSSGWVTVYDSYQTLIQDMENLHELELMAKTYEPHDYRPTWSFRQVLDPWIDPAQMSEEWLHWYSEFNWTNSGDYADVLTRVTIDVKTVLTEEDFA